jgi:hypothetical protein
VQGWPGWIRSTPGADVVVFFTYLYETARGNRRSSRPHGDDPHPTAHDERYARLRECRVFRHADGSAYFTPEEQRSSRRITLPRVGNVIDWASTAARGVGDRFRQRHGLGAEPTSCTWDASNPARVSTS